MAQKVKTRAAGCWSMVCRISGLHISRLAGCMLILPANHPMRNRGVTRSLLTAPVTPDPRLWAHETVNNALVAHSTPIRESDFLLVWDW